MKGVPICQKHCSWLLPTCIIFVCHYGRATMLLIKKIKKNEIWVSNETLLPLKLLFIFAKI